MEHDRKPKQSVKQNQKGTRRGYGIKRNKGNKETKGNKGNNWKDFCLLGSNANGIQAKKESLQKNVNLFKPSAITLQETKLRKVGSFKIPGYQIFEKVRSGFGGGLLTAVDEKLLPVLISTGIDENSEILVVQVKTQNHNIRIINAYGPQEENGKKDGKYDFWQELEQEVISAKEESCST